MYPELVIRNESGRIDGVRYDELAPMLFNEVQQQAAAMSGRLFALWRSVRCTFAISLGRGGAALDGFSKQRHDIALSSASGPGIKYRGDWPLATHHAGAETRPGAEAATAPCPILWSAMVSAFCFRCRRSFLTWHPWARSWCPHAYVNIFLALQADSLQALDGVVTTSSISGAVTIAAHPIDELVGHLLYLAHSHNR